MKVRNYVNEAKRTCVVVIDDCEYDVIRKVRKLFESRFGEDFGFRGHNSYLNGPIRGKARCAPEDTFNAEEGLEIARDRAFAKYTERYNKEVDYIIDRLETLAESLETLYKD